MSSSIDTHEEQQSQVEKANTQSDNDSETSVNPPSEDVKLESATESDIDSVDNEGEEDDQDVDEDEDDQDVDEDEDDQDVDEDEGEDEDEEEDSKGGEEEDEEGDQEEDNSLTHLLKRPNNIPCIGFHKEIIRRDDNQKRINILIHPPVEHVGFLKDVLREARVAAGGEEGDSDNDNVINNAKELSFYLAKIKKEGLSLPEGCTKSTFGKFYTKVSSLNEADKKLLAASQQITDNLEKQKSLENMEEDDDESEEEDENAFKKFEQEINKNFLVNFHPEITQINFAELNALSKMTRDKNGSNY